jgi:hypothetical protein
MQGKRNEELGHSKIRLKWTTNASGERDGRFASSAGAPE